MTGLYWLKTGREHGLTDERLRAAAADFCGLPRGDARLRVSRENGRPFFPSAPGIFCSATHSGGIWLCAVSTAPVGVDLQRHENRDILKIAERFFHPDEAAWLSCRPERFFDVWCAKESYVKYTGDGMLPGLDGFSVVCGDGVAAAVHGAALRPVRFMAGYSLCVCGGEGDVRIIELAGDETE